MIEDRIVSLSQPHIRPIVRGKARKPVDFGAKLSASGFEGYVFLDRMSCDNFNESGDLKAQIEAYYAFTGYYRGISPCRSHLSYKRKQRMVSRKRN